MILIVRRYKFNEKPTTFDKLGVGSFYITQEQLQCLGDTASINVKINSEKFNSVSLSTGICFNLESSAVVYKGD